MLFFKNYLVVTLLFISHLSKAADQVPVHEEKKSLIETVLLLMHDQLNRDLIRAVKKDDIELVKIILDGTKANVNYIKRSWSCLMSAQSKEMAQLLITHKADVNLEIDGKSTLHHAVEWPIDHLVKTLLEHKADIEAQDYDGNTPLHSAHTPKIAQLLLDHKADPRAKNAVGDTPVQTIASIRVLPDGSKIIQQLIEAKADIDHKNKKGQTALHIALSKQDADLAQCLLNAGASMTANDEQIVTRMKLRAKK